MRRETSGPILREGWVEQGHARSKRQLSASPTVSKDTAGSSYGGGTQCRDASDAHRTRRR